MTAPRPPIICRACKRRRHPWAHGMCSACGNRWDRAGRPADGPPPPTPPDEQRALAWEANRAARRNRVEDYAELTRQFGLSRAEAAARLGITERTTWRYEATLRELEDAQ